MFLNAKSISLKYKNGLIISLALETLGSRTTATSPALTAVMKAFMNTEYILCLPSSSSMSGAMLTSLWKYSLRISNLVKSVFLA